MGSSIKDVRTRGWGGGGVENSDAKLCGRGGGVKNGNILRTSFMDGPYVGCPEVVHMSRKTGHSSSSTFSKSKHRWARSYLHFVFLTLKEELYKILMIGNKDQHSRKFQAKPIAVLFSCVEL